MEQEHSIELVVENNETTNKRENDGSLELEEDQQRQLKKSKVEESPPILDIYGPQCHVMPNLPSTASSSSSSSSYTDDDEPIIVVVTKSRTSSLSSSSSSSSPSSFSSSTSDDSNDSDEYEQPGYTQFDLMETDYLFCMLMIKDAEEWRINETIEKLKRIYNELDFSGEIANYGCYKFDDMPTKEAFTDDVKKITIANYHRELLKKLKPLGATKEDSMMLFDLLNY